MSKQMGKGGDIWSKVVLVGLVVCMATVGYSVFKAQRESGAIADYRWAAEEMRLLAREITGSARATENGQEADFQALAEQLPRFEKALSHVEAAGLESAAGRIDDNWQPVKAASQILIDAAPRIVYVRGVSAELAAQIPAMQEELRAVVDRLRDQRVSQSSILAAQKTLWLSERMGRNMDRIYAGSGNSQQAADEFRTDAEEFIRIVEALTRGDALVGIDRIRDAQAVAGMSNAFRMFSSVVTSVDRVAEAAGELRGAAQARATVATEGAELGDSVAALTPAIDKLTVGGLYEGDNQWLLSVAPGVLAVLLLLVVYLGQGRNKRAAVDINVGLKRIGEGDLTVQLAEDNSAAGELAAQINQATARQRGMMRDLSRTFETALGQIEDIGGTAGRQVEKGQELTQSVAESMTAAEEMLRTSEEIKASTAKATETSGRNSEQVARGYELTQDMSKASAAVRESVQETSKSAKRQGELIQSVTAAAEYIQALNTKISVVAINTRIEAEKAGEYGRPFLGIAESIADLLREAEEEGRKIISQVRMLQNMSADNLGSMENTVGTVVSILQYIELMGESLEEINTGSADIQELIRAVDEAVGQSAVSAQHMNSSMEEIRQHNRDIVQFSESAQSGVGRLQASMQLATDQLGEFQLDGDGVEEPRPEPVQKGEVIARAENVSPIHPSGGQGLDLDEIAVLEGGEPSRASL